MGVACDPSDRHEGEVTHLSVSAPGLWPLCGGITKCLSTDWFAEHYEYLREVLNRRTLCQKFRLVREQFKMTGCKCSECGKQC